MGVAARALAACMRRADTRRKRKGLQGWFMADSGI
jgi:hypothetical protein